MSIISGKVIMVVLDGLRYDTARTQMGYMNHMVEAGKAACCRVWSELPSLSRPLYEVLLTGTPSSVNGITSNQTVRLSTQTSVFHLAREQGLRTAAAAYYWVSELYNRAPFDPIEDREQHDESRAIQHGKFYYDDSYPDSHLFADAELLRRRENPDFLYIHPMGIDDAGHRYGADSKEYRGKAIMADALLANLAPGWLELGYRVIVTSDHGMNADGQHGGTGVEEREVPLYIMGTAGVKPGYYEERVPQLAVAPLACRLLGLQPSAAMAALRFPGVAYDEESEGDA
ncbi:alkaline phosphatase family protein [Paenibacillus chartarius]|uniref:Alkaline phosphatase family protein n=1 Tax=Paenibacillus chartarius TaxID=747481 RepID=A0ABV6DVA3_9BACL